MGVLAIVVSHEGAEWLPEVLDALAMQTHRALDVLGVDNGSTDGSREIAVERLGEDRVLAADRDVGFPGAVAMALDSAAAARSEADWLLFVHDDLVLERDAVERLVAHGKERPEVGIIGPKLVGYDRPRILQQVGMSIDITGRADSGIEEDELDQGQHDDPRPVLYVSSAGMMVRRDLFKALGSFDRRYHAFGEDLDLCWRAWLAGSDVEVEPAAVARHVGGLSTYRRTGGTVGESARFYSERNTLATLLKCYGAAWLAVVLPLFFVVGIAKVLGFVATRRVSDVWQTLRAWVWNLGHVRSTLRLRRQVQDRRVRRDRELRSLFIRIVPRLQAYAEAIAERVSADPSRRVDAPADDEDAVTRTLLTHPVAIAATALGIVAIAAALPLLRSGVLRGGDFAAWPASALDFLRAYASGWTDVGGAGTPDPTSPAQAVLGLLTGLVAGNGWLAARVLLLGAPAVAWFAAYRAAGSLTPVPVARVAAATLYALSPPAIVAVTTGDLGAMVAFALLPVLVLVGGLIASTRVAPATAWRATAAGSIVLAVVIAFEPSTLWLAGVFAAVGIVATAGSRGSFAERRNAVARIGLTAAGALLLLLPWSPSLFVSPSPLLADPGATWSAAPFLRWLVLSPGLPGFPSTLVGLAYVAVGLFALLVAAHRVRLAVGVLWSIVLLAALVGWRLGRVAGPVGVGPVPVLLVGAAAYAGLLAAAVGAARQYLARHAFGWRQVGAAFLAVVISVGMIGAVAHLLDDPWDAFDVGAPALPGFLTVGDAASGPYRVLVLSHDQDHVRWDVTGADGPTMVEFGTARSVALAETVGETVEATMARSDPSAAARLGLANFRFVYVPEGGRSPDLEAALGDQFDLEPQAVERGLVFQVNHWVPRVVFVGQQSTLALVGRGELPAGSQPREFARIADDAYGGAAPGRGSILLGEPVVAGWTAVADGRPLDASALNGLVRFSVPAGAERVSVRYAGQGRRTALVAMQGALALLAISLVLRPPSFVRQNATVGGRP